MLKIQSFDLTYIRVFFAASLIASIISCKKENANPDPESSSISCTKKNPYPGSETLILGDWEWYLTLIPKPPQTITPSSSGNTASVTFTANDSVHYYYNGVVDYTLPYEFDYRLDDSLDPNSDSTLVLKINHTPYYFCLKNDTLVIDGSYRDVPRNEYVRK